MTSRERVNILLVDDHPGKLLSYEAILTELDENLVKADSGREALEWLLKLDIAVILLDVNMPEMDGFELASMIRGHPRFQETAIIFISAVHLTDLDRLQGYQRGAVDYIAVPINPELLRAKVSVFADLHRKKRQLKTLNGNLRHLSSSLIVTQDEERRRIARELHDGLGQELSALKTLLDGFLRPELSAEWKQNAATESVTLLERAIQQVRTMSYLLHPPFLDELGLSLALEEYVLGFGKRSGIKTSLDFGARDVPRLKAELETAIFRIVQEALTNVFRHSDGHSAQVRVLYSETEVEVSVQDDGKGISERVLGFQPGSIGIGIAGMRQRVKEFRGEVWLQNTNPGTLVRVRIPVEPVAGPVQNAEIARK